MASGSVVTTTCAAVRLLGLRAFDLALAIGLTTGFPAALLLTFLTTTARTIFTPPIGSIFSTHGSRATRSYAAPLLCGVHEAFDAASGGHAPIRCRKATIFPK